MPPVPSSLLDRPSHFSLDTAGALGLLGGDSALSSLITVHVYGNRRWFGWYNNPGSFQISKKLASFAKSAPLPGTPMFPSDSQAVHTDPMALFKRHAYKGLKFRAAHSGTVIEETGSVTPLFMKECAAWASGGRVVPGRTTQPVWITIVDLGEAPPSEVRPGYSRSSTLLFASVPIAVSIGTCALCAIYEDLYASALILVGIIASGISSLVLGSADFIFTHPVPAKGSPAGDGILTSDKDIVLLKGTESAVNSITRGQFSLRFSSRSHFNLVQWCSFLFIIQCIVQLLLIPQASLLGQVMFLTSLGVSALYNAWVSSSMDKETVLRNLLLGKVFKNPKLTTYTLGTRTTAVVFILLVLQLQDPKDLLDELLPNDTKVWRHWKATILAHLRHLSDQPFQFGDKLEDDLDVLTQQEKDLLELLYADAQAAYDGYKNYLQADAL